jgi:putative spermidine/putrescine transport system substrate-binding protein
MPSATRRLLCAGVVAALAALLAACGAGDRDLLEKREKAERARAAGSSTATTLKAEPLARLGTPEGELSIIAPAGYAEDGSTDELVNWVAPFEKATGCRVTVTTATSPEHLVQLVEDREYDVVAAPGQVSRGLIAAGEVQPVNTDLVPNYADIEDDLKRRPWNSVRGVEYGVPHGWGANVLMYRTDQVRPAPTSWAPVFAAESPYGGKITAYDSPLSIADAALYLMTTKPDLGIENPYALDEDQLTAATDLLKQQNANIGDYWDDYLQQLESFKSGAVVVGTSWQSVVNLAKAEKAPLEAVLPAEGATGWSDTWMLAADAEHRTCAYKWLDHVVSPDVNAVASEWLGQAPANPKACRLTLDTSHCETYHAGDAAYFAKVWPWTTPMADCVDGRDEECTSWADWARAWDEVMG